MTLPHTSPTEPRVSVVTPFLNVERFIVESIESVLAQTYPSWELLLVDDGSSDASTAIARRYAELYPDRIRYFEHEGHTNRGASVSRNVGIRHARGEYVALLDADDVWLPHKLEQQVRLLDARPDVGSLYGNTLYWYSWTGEEQDRNRDFEPRLGFPPNTFLLPPTLLIDILRQRAAVPCACSIIMRRSVVQEVGGFVEEFHSLFTDQSFLSKLFLAAPVFVADGCWDRYRQHAESSCAVAEREGRVRERRAEYLRWFERYLMARDLAHGELWRVVQSALWRYRHPHLHRVRSALRHPRGAIRRVLGVARALLPPRARVAPTALHRVLLAATAVLALFAAAPAPVRAQTEPQRVAPERYRQLARDILAELVGINTTEAHGSTTIAAEAMRTRLLGAGFPAADVVVIEPVPRKGNLIARMRGRDRTLRPILLLAHIDVVAAQPEDWTLPPFELIERDGTFFGRGTADDKDEAAIYVANLIRMKEEGFVPQRDIIVALTADEEGGPDNGVVWLLENRRELIDAEYALNEGGGGILDENGRRVSHTVQASEKKYQNFTVEATNPGGHSSRPRPDNAIYELADALLRIGAYHFPVRLNEVTREYFRRSADLEDRATGDAMRRLVANPADTTAIAALSRDARNNSTMRTTCVATLLEGGHAPNALPQRARANVNCRILPDESPESVRLALQRAAGGKVTVTADGQAVDSPPSPLDPRVLAPVERITREMWGDVPVVPTMSTGATDGLYLRNAGIPVYGVSGLFYGETYAHGMNERVPVQSFYEGQEFLYRLVKELAVDRSSRTRTQP